MKIIRINLQSTLITVLFIINICLPFFPLVNIIGYEFSVINSILMFLFSGLIAIRNDTNCDIFSNQIKEHLRRTRKFFVISALLPLLIGITSTVLFSECPFTDGILFYFVIAVPSIFFGYLSGFIVANLFSKLKKTFFLLLFLIILVAPILEIYLYPQIYFFNLIIGFFPGTIYDEGLSVDHLLISYRIFNLAIILTLVFITIKVKLQQIKRSLAIILSFLIITGFLTIKPQIGYATNLSRLENELNNKVSTENFDIYIFKEIDANERELLLLMHEYYYEQLKQILQLKRTEKISSFVFKDKEQKNILFGAENANVAKPWLNQIYLNFSNYEESLKHEVVHILLNNYGSTIFQVADNLNPAMIEGFAMALEDDYDGMEIHEVASLAKMSNYEISLTNLFSGLNFFSSYSAIAYIYSGSFLKFIIENYGIKNAMKLYSDTNFNKILKKDIHEIQKEYFSFIDSLKINFNKHRAQLYFGGQTIFQKHCVRSAASQIKKGWELYNQNNFIIAAYKFEKVYKYSNSYQALVGQVSSLLKLKKNSEAKKILESELNKFMQSRYFYNLELLLGDTYILNGELEKGEMLYDSLYNQSPHIQYTNEVVVRKNLISIEPDTLKFYLQGDIDQKCSVLLSINQQEIVYESIPIFLKYNKDKTELKNFLNCLKDKVSTENEESVFALIELSKAAMKLNDYKLAKYFAVKSFDYRKDNQFKHSQMETLKLANWLANFSTETKNHFTYYD